MCGFFTAAFRSGKMRASRLNKKYLWAALRIGLGLLFIAASYYKIVSPGAFAHQIYNYKFLPVWAVNPMAIVLPWLQLFCGIALLINRFTTGAAFLLTLMMLAFQIALAAALVRGLNISCGCFKTGGSPATWGTFGRDFLILMGSAALLRSSFRRSRHPSMS